MRGRKDILHRKLNVFPQQPARRFFLFNQETFEKQSFTWVLGRKFSRTAIRIN